MDNVFEVLKAVLALGATYYGLRWLFADRSSVANEAKPAPAPVPQKATSTLSSKKDSIEMKDIGLMAGMMGGEMEDAFVAKYTLERAKISQAEREREEKPKD